MKPETVMLLAAVGVGAYFLMSKQTTPVASFAIPGGSVVLGTSSGIQLNGLGNRKRPTIQPGVVPVRGNRTGQRKVGWNV